MRRVQGASNFAGHAGHEREKKLRLRSASQATRREKRFHRHIDMQHTGDIGAEASSRYRFGSARSRVDCFELYCSFEPRAQSRAFT
jgi:hypothetical protein